MPVYEETQQSPIRVYLLGTAVLTMGGFSAYLINQFTLFQEDKTLLWCFLTGQLIFLTVLGSMLYRRLDARIDESGVHFRAPLAWFRWQSIPWAQIDRIYVREYALLGEYPRGFLGFRQGPGGFATAPLYGTFGLQVDKHTGGICCLLRNVPMSYGYFWRTGLG